MLGMFFETQCIIMIGPIYWNAIIRQLLNKKSQKLL